MIVCNRINLSPIDTETPAASQTCLTISVGSRMKKEANCSSVIVLYKIVHELIDIPPSDYLTQNSSRARAAHKDKYEQYSTSTASSRGQSHIIGTDYQQPQLGLPPWYHQEGAVWPNLLMGNHTQP